MVLFWFRVCSCIWLYPFSISYSDLSVRVHVGIVFISWHINLLVFLLRCYFALHIDALSGMAFFEHCFSSTVSSVMPACVTIFDKNCKPVMELGEGPYNTLRWNPKGRGMILFFILLFFVSCFVSFLYREFVYIHVFVTFNRCSTVLCVAGFGNLPGDMVNNVHLCSSYFQLWGDN